MSLLALILLACSSPIPQETPYLWIGRGPDAFVAATPTAERRTDMEILFATDREELPSQDSSAEFGTERSSVLRYGVATVALDPFTDWKALVEATTTLGTTGGLAPVVRDKRIVASLGLGAEDDDYAGDLLAPTASFVAREVESRRALAECFAERLARAERKDVYIYVHGFNTDFDTSVADFARLWHFMGRPGVALLYAWPARRGFFGYPHDRESVEFTVRHLKNVLGWVAERPGVGSINIVAHSLGAAVVATALREIHLRDSGPPTIVATGASPAVAVTSKIGSVALAAPDIDIQVFEERWVRERVFEAAKRTAIYSNPADGATLFAGWLFGSVRRVGGFLSSDLRPEIRNTLMRLECVEMVDCEVGGRSSDHFCALLDPSVSSDLVMFLTEPDATAGARRASIQRENGMWTIDNAYLRPPGALKQAAEAAAARRRRDY